MGKPVIRSDSDPMQDGEMTYGNPANDIIQNDAYEDKESRDYADLRKMAHAQGGDTMMDIADQNQPNPIKRNIKADHSMSTGLHNGDGRRVGTKGYSRLK